MFDTHAPVLLVTGPGPARAAGTDSDDDSDAFQESFQELPTFPQGAYGSSQGHAPPLQTSRVGFTLPPGGQTESDSAISPRNQSFAQTEPDSGMGGDSEGKAL